MTFLAEGKWVGHFTWPFHCWLMQHSLQKGVGWTFHLAVRIVSPQANAAFPAEGNGLDISPGL